ncbi:ATP-binding cassette domain-containing protein [Desulfatibacillum aliphaticivorans]|uniref:ATP-binding cassette domain-containing protein n=1 Tax=Desulfatibacillum aliphaticivorans TaxID=218208 RepID=UPI0003F59888|nr:ATP-binding cassette domain-containing protein [Desulfatibacillum aliphaticivorans]
MNHRPMNSKADNSPASLVVFEDVSLQANGKTLFDGLNWTLEAGQNWTVFGPNGSGKSFLAKALFRSIPLVRGRILFYFDGPDAKPRTYLRPNEIVSISQDDQKGLMRRYASYHQARWQSFEQDAPTVEDYLRGKARANRFQMRETGEPAPDIPRDAWEQALALFKIEYLLPRRLIHISNGEARKVLIARALLKHPKLLILDDPFTGLDAASRDALAQALNGMARAGTLPFVMLTSREDEIMDCSGHVLCVEDSREVFQGPKEKMPAAAGALSIASSPQPEFKFPAPKENPAAGFKTLAAMKKVTISYGGEKVLDQVDWVMKPGERWALLGHNGAGKSTLLSLVLADNPQAYANDISLFDVKRGSGESIWEIKRRIGCVSPESQIYHGPGVTCLQAVCSGFFDTVGLYHACSPEQEQTARQWLEGFDLEHLADRSFLAVSTGERRLTLLARALVKNPALLALDEPCQGLDARHRARIIRILDELCAQSSMSMIFISHHVDEMPKSITHVLRLEKGRVVECGRRA